MELIPKAPVLPAPAAAYTIMLLNGAAVISGIVAA